jgi:hypothetical protein
MKTSPLNYLGKILNVSSLIHKKDFNVKKLNYKNYGHLVKYFASNFSGPFHPLHYIAQLSHATSPNYNFLFSDQLLEVKKVWLERVKISNPI